MKVLVIALVAGLSFAGIANAARDVPAALQPYMTQEEYRAAGLHKLNPAERAQFQAWFVRTVEGRGVAPTEAATPTPGSTPRAETPAQPSPRRAAEPSFGGEFVEADADSDRELVARVVGEFRGWDGPTRFQLDNGQVWETVGSVSFTPTRPIQDAQVTIRRGAFGAYRLRVEGYNRSVQVKRIE